VTEGTGRPRHLIDRDEVPGWLADSVNKRVTYHRTTSNAAREIVERGVDVARSRVGAYGQGFYSATRGDPFFGDVELAVAIRLVRPLQGGDAAVGEVIDAIANRLEPGVGRITPRLAGAVRRVLLDLGYDGIIVTDGGGDGIDYVIALDGASVRLLWP
jgi:hypothetical protein